VRGTWLVEDIAQLVANIKKQLLRYGCSHQRANDHSNNQAAYQTTERALGRKKEPGGAGSEFAEHSCTRANDEFIPHYTAQFCFTPLATFRGNLFRMLKNFGYNEIDGSCHFISSML
jgi:hypothetical protein